MRRPSGGISRDEDDLGADLLRRLVLEAILVPGHWRSELANGLLVGERRGRSEVAQVDRVLRLVNQLDIEVDAEGADAALVRILPLARAHRLTVYDTLYLEVAERRGVPLATFDQALARAAASVGVITVGIGATR